MKTVYKIVFGDSASRGPDGFVSGSSLVQKPKWKCTYRLNEKTVPRVDGSMLFAFESCEDAIDFIDEEHYYVFRLRVECGNGSVYVLECTTGDDAFKTDAAAFLPNWSEFWRVMAERANDTAYLADIPVSAYLKLSQLRHERQNETVDFKAGVAPMGTILCSSITPLRVVAYQGPADDS